MLYGFDVIAALKTLVTFYNAFTIFFKQFKMLNLIETYFITFRIIPNQHQ